MKAFFTLLLIVPLLGLAAGKGLPSANEDDGVPNPPEALRRTPVARVVRIVVLVGAAYLAFGVLVLLLENRLIYYPVRYPAGMWEFHGLSVEDCTFEAEDGVELHAWWLHAARTEAAPVLLWFHGNAGNITHRADNLRMLAERDVDVLIVDYRGYGKSEGRPSEKGLYLDGEAAYDYLTRERGVEAGRIVCFGRSLGAAVALHVAVQRPVAGVVLESPFASARAMARRMMPVIPLGPFIRSRFDNVGTVSKLDVPLLVLHGDRDELVPFKQGRAVFEAAPQAREFYTIRGAGHNDTYLVGGEPYFEALLDFCRRCVKSRP